MSARLVDTLDIIKQEFEAMTSEIETIRSQKDDFESKGPALLFCIKEQGNAFLTPFHSSGVASRRTQRNKEVSLRTRVTAQ
jgi:hypothetical protein